MSVAGTCIAIAFAVTSQHARVKMTYAEAKAKIPSRELPEFWVGHSDGLAERWSRIKRGEVRQIAKSPGGRPIHLICYGEREPLESRANFNSAVGGRDTSAYMDKARREKPVVFFIGPVHGHEIEALTGLASFVNVMETGADLAGRPQQALRELGMRCRLLIIPLGSPDGTARFEPRAGLGMSHHELAFWAMGTWSDDTIAFWPTSKLQHPRTGKRIGFMGCYFNDDGVNPMHDEFFNPMGPEAPAILRVAQDEGPDLAVSLHSHEGAPALLRTAYVPTEMQAEVRDMAVSYYEVLNQRGLPHGRPFQPQAESGNPPAPFNLTSAVYHVSGATAFTFECPHGLTDENVCHVTAEQILDIQLTLYEAMLRHALSRKDRPVEK